MEYRGKRIPILAAAAFQLLRPPSADAQVELSGMLDIATKWDVGKEAGEADSQINQAFKGGGPLSLVRGRFFVDSAINEEIEVSSTLLYDEAVGRMELEGAWVRLLDVAGYRHLNVQVGKMPTVFGSFAARSFGVENPLIGIPLIYHYFSAISGAGVPSGNAEQLTRRDAANYRSRGLPTLYDACWNTGIEVNGTSGDFDFAVALTRGAVSNPVGNGGDGVQFVGRIGANPRIGLVLGVSIAHGSYLNASVERDADFPVGKSADDYDQTVFGVDLAYSRDHLELFAELMRNRWEIPNLEESALSNTGGYVEAKYALFPGVGLSVRYGMIVYDKISDGTGGQAPWDYDVRRVETGLEYYIDRNVRAKAVVQFNNLDGAADNSDHIVGLQLATFF